MQIVTLLHESGRFCPGRLCSVQRRDFRAVDEVAKVLVRMQREDHLELLMDLGPARLAMRDAAVQSQGGYARQRLWDLDEMLERLTR